MQRQEGSQILCAAFGDKTKADDFGISFAMLVWGCKHSYTVPAKAYA